MADAMATLHQAAEIVRVQIPKGELTLASVQQLLQGVEGPTARNCTVAYCT